MLCAGFVLQSAMASRGKLDTRRKRSRCFPSPSCVQKAPQAHAPSPKRTSTRLAGLPSQSWLSRKPKFLVLILIVTTTGTANKYFLNAHVPPGVDANSTTESYFPCSFSWLLATNCRSRTSSRTSPSCLCLQNSRIFSGKCSRSPIFNLSTKRQQLALETYLLPRSTLRGL